MSTTTVKTPAPADRVPADTAPAGKGPRRGERSLAGSLTSHGILGVASLIALFPIAWLVYLSLGPDKDDYLHPGGILGKMTSTTTRSCCSTRRSSTGCGARSSSRSARPS